MDVDQEPVREPEPAAQRAQCTDHAPDLSTLIASLARLLARQAAREHLHRLSHLDMEDTSDESRSPATLSKLHLIDEVAEILGLSTRTVRRLIASGELVACRLGRSVRIHPDDLARYIDRHRG